MHISAEQTRLLIGFAIACAIAAVFIDAMSVFAGR